MYGTCGRIDNKADFDFFFDLIVTGMKQNSQNVPSLHGVELNVLIDEMLESSALVRGFY